MEVVNRLRKTYDDASFESFEYDGLGRIKKETDRMGNEKTYDYDCRGNLSMFKNEDDITTINSYDENNNLILSKTGEDTTKYEYDLRGNIKKETRERVHLYDEEEVVEKHVREYTYDFRNNVKTCIDENGNLVTEKFGVLTKTL